MVKKVGKLQAELGLDKKKFDRGMKDAGKQGSQFGKVMKRIGGVLAAAFAIHKIVQWGRAVYQAYQVQKEAEVKLATVIKQRMGLGDKVVQSLKKQAAEYQKIGIIGDEIQLSGLQQLATFLKQKESLESLLPAMNNLLAQQKGNNATAQDAVGIANMMGRVLAGQVSALSRVGITFSEAQEKALRYGNELEKSAALSEVIYDNVGNMNEELGKTDLGKVQRWKNAWGDFKEMLGAKLVPILGKVAEWGLKALPKIGEGFRAIARPVVAVINYFIDLYNESTAFRAIVEGIKFTFKVVFGFIKLQIKNVVDAFVGLGKILKDVFTGNFKAIGGHAKEAFEGIKENAEDYGQDVATAWNKMMENMTKKPHIQLIEIRARGAGEITTGEGSKKTAAKGPSLMPTLKSRGLAVPAGAELVDMGKMRTAHEVIGETRAKLAALNAEMMATSGLTAMIFDGMAGSIQDAFNETGSVLENFGKFFIDFIKQMIFRLVAATIAATALAAAISFVTGGLGTAGGVTFGTSFKNIFGKFSGFGDVLGFQKGGIVPPGFPNDTFPAMLSSGERVLTPSQIRNIEPQTMRFRFEEIGIRNNTIWLAVKEADRKHRNSY